MAIGKKSSPVHLDRKRFHAPARGMQLHALQFAIARAGESAIALAKEFRNRFEAVEGLGGMPNRGRSREGNVSRAVAAANVHDHAFRVFADVKISGMINARKEPPTQQAYQDLIGVTPPD